MSAAKQAGQVPGVPTTEQTARIPRPELLGAHVTSAWSGNELGPGASSSLVRELADIRREIQLLRQEIAALRDELQGHVEALLRSQGTDGSCC